MIYKPAIQAVLTVNRKAVGTAIAKHFRQSLEAAFPGLPILAAEISQRVAFAESVTTGTTVLEMEPKGQAAQEIIALAIELQELSRHAQDIHRTAETTAR